MVKRQPHLFLDCDGVLADFDAGARKLVTCSNHSSCTIPSTSPTLASVRTGGLIVVIRSLLSR